MKEERKRRVRAWKEAERANREASLPISRESLEDLRAHVAREFELGLECDHSCRITREWLDARAIAPGPVLDALLDLGGRCDCEVLANVRSDDVFGAERAPVSVPAAKVPRVPLPSGYEDEAMVLTPQRPWRIIDTNSAALLTLRLGKGGSGPVLNVLEGRTDPGSSGPTRRRSAPRQQ